MNINDVEETEEIPEDIQAAIFQRQYSKMEKYHEIEKKNGLLQTEDCPVNLDDRFGQARLKDFAWRMTEEFTEATECMHTDNTHFIEELVDGLHFLVELMILAGFYPTGDMKPRSVMTSITVYHVIEPVGKAMNCLKNKPWKQTHMATDKEKFYGYLQEAWSNMIFLFEAWAIKPPKLYQLYYRKSEVNKFRQRSNY